MRRNPRWAAAAAAAAALALTACGHGTPSASSGAAGAGGAYGGSYGSQSSMAPPASSPAAGQGAALEAESTGAGTVLATGQGLTVYYYAEDKPGSGTSACTGGCAAIWPPLTTPVHLPAGMHLPGPLGSISRPGGAGQVTVNGYPVYRYAGDKAPGQANGNGVEGRWHVIKLSGASGQERVLKTETTAAGTVLANPSGLTVYYYAEDKPGSGTSACTGGCAGIWPPVRPPVHIPAGMHLPGPLGVITRPDGTRQITINGYPVYRYAGDKAPGQANGNGVEGQWHVIRIG